jgi:acyl-CoA synthetase (AMP-forming)/AMP-acid ligase II
VTRSSPAARTSAPRGRGRAVAPSRRAHAAWFGIPDRLWGEAVTAVVIADPGADELRAFCRAQLADFMRPKHLHLADALPRNPYGKALKRELRELYAEG